MPREKESRALQQQLHELRNQRIHEADPGTEEHRELIRQLDGLDADHDAAQNQWFAELTTTHLLPKALDHP